MVDKIPLIQLDNKPCESCNISVTPSEWHFWCPTHLKRSHIECNLYLSRSYKHKKTKFIERNIPNLIKDIETKRKGLKFRKNTLFSKFFPNDKRNFK